MARELGETMDDNELQEMIDRADQNGDGVISFEEFYNIMTKKTFAWLIILNFIYFIQRLLDKIVYIHRYMY